MQLIAFFRWSLVWHFRSAAGA